MNPLKSEQTVYDNVWGIRQHTTSKLSQLWYYNIQSTTETLQRKEQRNRSHLLKGLFVPFCQTKQYSRSSSCGKWIMSYFFTRLYLLPWTFNGNNEKNLAKLCTSVRSYPAVEPKKAVNQWFGSQQCYMQSAKTPSKTVVWNHHDHRVEVLGAFSQMPQVSWLDSKAQGLNLFWHCCSDRHQYGPHNSCLH